jgi:hypothetical protein
VTRAIRPELSVLEGELPAKADPGHHPGRERLVVHLDAGAVDEFLIAVELHVVDVRATGCLLGGPT